jgi:hypothetical protein
LIEQIRNGIVSMRATGANPTLAVLNPTDTASLDLSTSGADDQYVLRRGTGSSSRLWGLRVIERTSTSGTEPPYLVYPAMLGILYLGAIRFDVDP